MCRGKTWIETTFIIDAYWHDLIHFFYFKNQFNKYVLCPSYMPVTLLALESWGLKEPSVPVFKLLTPRTEMPSNSWNAALKMFYWILLKGAKGKQKKKGL